jgi:glycosyltransferase involved in cell wall biosynthesis
MNATVVTPLTVESEGPTRGKIGWLFGLGHGHYAQFLNFQESFPPEEVDRAVWIGLEYGTSGDPLSRIPLVPKGLRLRRNVGWHARTGLAQEPEWDALFFAVEQMSLLPVIARHRSYLYVDLTPSLKAELAPWYAHQLSRNPVLNRMKTELHAQLCRAARGVFAMSEWSAAGVLRDYRVPANRVHVTLPGANLSRWRFVDRSQRSQTQPVRILFVGGEFLRKGGGLLLQWAEHTATRGWEIDIVTWPGQLPGWAADLLERPTSDGRISATLAPRLPSVRVHCGLSANSPEVIRLFEAADVFCLPTMADGTPIATLEAMATGLPVLVGQVGGIPELIADDETGFLLKPGDLSDLDAKLHALVSDPVLRRRIGRSGRRACEEYFNVDRQLREILAVIDSERAPSRFG